MATTIEWPPYLPQLAAVSFDIPDTRLISQNDVGPAKVRNRFTYAPIAVFGQLVLDSQQMTQFLAFYQTTLQRGALTFNWQHPVTDALTEVRFKSVGSFALFKTGHATNRTWTTNVVLEVLGAA